MCAVFKCGLFERTLQKATLRSQLPLQYFQNNPVVFLSELSIFFYLYLFYTHIVYFPQWNYKRLEENNALSFLNKTCCCLGSDVTGPGWESGWGAEPRWVRGGRGSLAGPSQQHPTCTRPTSGPGPAPSSPHTWARLVLRETYFTDEETGAQDREIIANITSHEVVQPGLMPRPSAGGPPTALLPCIPSSLSVTMEKSYLPRLLDSTVSQVIKH